MIEGPDGWKLAPEGAAVHPVERVAVIADVHLGYEWARAAHGDCLPSHSLAETLAKLEALLGRVPIARQHHLRLPPIKPLNPLRLML